MKTLLSLVPLLVGLTVGAQPAYLNYQGRLTDTAGQPLSGMKTLTFNIYTNALVGTNVWGPFLCDGSSGTGHTAQAYLNSDGRFNVILGDQDTNGRSITVAFTNSVERYIEISVNGGPPIQPRQQFLSAPYALQSTKALQADVAASLVQELADALCPPGTIVAFGGRIDNIPRGWLLCDGRPLKTDEYNRLYQAIETSWGDGSTSQDGTLYPVGTSPYQFNLPDLRGLFLRGVTHDRKPGTGTGGALANNAWGDPDWDLRPSSRAGGLYDNNVGSVQTSAFETHTHLFGVLTWTGGGSEGAFDSGDSGESRWGTTSATGGLETRPKNAYVHYIIKY